jgi:Helix-turn-helix domain
MKESNKNGSGARAGRLAGASVVSSPVDPASILTPEELAARLKVSPRWIYEKSRKRNANPLPVLRLGRYLRFDWLAVSVWLRSQSGAA